MDQSRLLINNKYLEEQKVIDIFFDVKLRNKVAVNIENIVWKNKLFFFERKKTQLHTLILNACQLLTKALQT